MTIRELVNALQAMMENKVIDSECEIEVHDVINDEQLEIIGYDVYNDGSLNLKAREK